MKNLYILICLITCVVLSESCREETFVENEPEIIVDPPEEIDYPVFVGKVSNKLDVIADATVRIFQDDHLLGEVKTDDEGNYTTATVEIPNNNFVTLEILKDEHATAYRRRDIDDPTVTKTINIHLQQLEDLDLVAPPLPNPGSSIYFSLSGYVKDVNGQGSGAFMGIQYEFETPSGNHLALWGHVQYPDATGYYEFLLPKGVDLLISVRDTFCGEYITGFDDRIFMGLEGEAFGPYNNNVILPDFINPRSSAPSILVSGDLLACDGSQVDVGYAYVRFVEADGSDYTIVNSFSNGSYAIVQEDCKSLPVDVYVHTLDEVNNRYSDTLMMTVTSGDLDWQVSNLTSCNPGVPGNSEILFTVNGVSHSFNDILVRWEGSDLVSDEPTSSFAFFTIPNAQVGSNDINGLQMFSFLTGESFTAVAGSVNLTLDIVNSDFVQGTFDGDFTDVSGNTVQGSGTINLVLD